MITVLYPVRSEPPFRGNVPTAATAHGWEPQPSATERFVRPFKAALQDFGGFPAQGTITTARQGSSDVWPERYVHPVDVALQRFTDEFAERGLIATVPTPQGWWPQPSKTEIFKAPIQVGLPQFQDGYAVRGTVPTIAAGPGYLPQGSATERFVKPSVVVHWPLAGYPERGSIPAPSLSLAWGTWPDLFTLAAKPTMPLFTSFAELGNVASPVIPQGWLAQLAASERYIAPLSPVNVQFFAFDPAGFITVVRYGSGDEWPGLRRNPTVPFPVQARPFTAEPPSLQVASPTTPHGWSAQDEWPVRFTRPVKVSLQRVSDDFPQQGSIAVTAPTPQGWWTVQPDFFRRPAIFGEGGNFAPAFTPRGVIFSISPQGWPAIFPELFRRPVPPGEQDHGGFVPEGTITIVRYGATDEWPVRFLKPVAVAIQPVTDILAVRGNVPASPITTDVWDLWPERFKRPFSVAEQLHFGYAEAGLIPTGTAQGWGGRDEWPARFVRPINVSIQVVSEATPNQGNVPLPFVARGRDEWPDIFRRPLRVSLQPVWGYPEAGNVPSLTQHGWAGRDAWPEKFVKPVSVAIQFTSADLTARGLIASGFVPLERDEWPLLYKAPIAVTLPQFETKGTTIYPPNGWAASWSDRFTRPIAVSLQFAAGVYPERGLTPSPVVPLGARDEWPALIKKPISVALPWVRDDFPARGLFQSAPLPPQGWWGDISYSFRNWRTVSGSQEFLIGHIRVSFVYQPTLLGAKVAPSIQGTKQAPGVSGRIG